MGRLENSSADSKQVRHDIREIQKINEMTEGKLTWKEFFSNGREMNGWRAMAAFLSQAFQQIGGINLVGVFSFVPPPFLPPQVCVLLYAWRANVEVDRSRTTPLPFLRIL